MPYMGSHSVTCHPTEVRIPPLPPAETGTRFSDPGGMQGWVDNHTSNSPYTTTCLPRRTYIRTFTSMITPLCSSDIHLLHQSRTNTVTASHAIAVAAPRIWNSLPTSVTACINYCTFKTKLKTHTYFPPSGPNNSASDIFLTNYGAI